jgi:hypothetical protein
MSTFARRLGRQPAKLTHMGIDGSCNTAGCALGWGPTVPQLRKEGLRLRRSCIDGINEINVVFRRRRGYAAGRAFFGLTMAESEYLFDPSTYRSGWADSIQPKAVAARMQNVLDGKFRKRKYLRDGEAQWDFDIEEYVY